MELLVEAGAHVNSVDKDGDTAIDLIMSKIIGGIDGKPILPNPSTCPEISRV